MQYTIRNVPRRLDKELREAARKEGKSLNQTVLERLMVACGLTGEELKRRDLGEVAGHWTEDEAVEDALKAQREIDLEMWK
jgi:hypothetical protein